jgi:hypothetical protein
MLPSHKAVRELLAEATGRAVTVAPAEPFAPGPDAAATFGVYVDERMHTRVVVACDLELSALLGAAIRTVPPGGVEGELADRRLSPGTADALRGLLGGLAELLRPASEEQVSLHAMYPPGEEPPGDLLTYVRTRGGRLDLAVTVGGYGGGVLALVRPATV